MGRSLISLYIEACWIYWMKDTSISFSQWPCSWIFKPTCYLKTQKPTACRNIYNLSDLAFSCRKQMFMQVTRVKVYTWFLRHSFQGTKTNLKDKFIMFLPLLHNYQYWREAHNSYPFLWLASTNKIRKKDQLLDQMNIMLLAVLLLQGGELREWKSTRNREEEEQLSPIMHFVFSFRPLTRRKT